MRLKSLPVPLRAPMKSSVGAAHQMDRPIVVADRIVTASAVVALESSVLAQGLPSPANLESAEAQSVAVSKSGAEPAVVGVIGVMATGGIGGIHFGTGDVSADLPQLARSRSVVVCSGPKHVADAAATLEWLETWGVLVVGYRTDRLPGFLARGRLPLEHVVNNVGEVVELLRVRRALDSTGALVLVQNPPAGAAMDPDELAELSAEGASAARNAGVVGKARTPFELDWLHRRTGGRSLAANLALLEANAGLAGEVASALALG